MTYLTNLVHLLYSQASDYLNSPIAGNVITQDIINPVNRPLLFPHQPIGREGFNCFQMLVLAESSPRAVQISAYYPSSSPFALDHPLYIIDYDDNPDPNNQLWFFVSAVFKGRPETIIFLTSLADKFGFTLSVRPSPAGEALLVAEPAAPPA